MPCARAAAGDAILSGLPVELDVPGARLVDPEHGAGDLGAAGAHEPGQPDDLAGVHVHVDVGEAAGHPEVAEPEHELADRGDLLRVDVGQLAADHQLDDPLLLGVRGVEVGDPAPVAHDGDAVRDRHDLLEAVADEQHRHAVVLEVLDHLEQPVGLADGQRGGGLVEDQDPCVEGERLGDLHQLLLRGAQQPGRHRRGRPGARASRASGGPPGPSGRGRAGRTASSAGCPA